MRYFSFFEVDLIWCKHLLRLSSGVHDVCNGTVMTKENSHFRELFVLILRTEPAIAWK